MNFLDPYDITAGSSTPPPNQPDRSLNEEVTQVIGQLNSFWGSFKKQSQSAFQNAQKDFSGVVTQAQRELTRLTSDAPQDDRGEGQSGTRSEDDTHPRTSSETVKPPVSPVAEPSTGDTTSTTAAPTLLSRLQSALPPNVVSTVQQHIPESIKHVTENTDFAQLRTNLSSELQRLQGVTRTQAEEYVHKSEALLREAVREASEVLKDAVKVIPPESSTSDLSTGLIWDGSDMWMLPSDGNDGGTSSDNGKGKATAQSAVATRAEALLRRLKHDPEIIKHDPEGDQGVRQLYANWLNSEYDAKGGIESEHWSTKIDNVLKDGEDGRALQTTVDSVVPSAMSKDEFWKRYFFRVHQIQTEEEKRKALVQGTAESDEDFSWEDDETEDSTTTQSESKTTPTPPSLTAAAAADDTTATGPSSQPNTPANTSPRESEDSYDLVSSGNVSASGEDKTATKKPAPTESDDGDDDSDWE
ncbi:hypothetical protein K435DRAFT_775592, partial [Dendrothele bispora CBS 962.96]